MESEKIFPLRIVSAVAIDGKIYKAGSVVRLGEADAKELLRREKAVPHADPEAAEAAEAAEQPAAETEKPAKGKTKAAEPEAPAAE